jgi:hypothetical protein
MEVGGDSGGSPVGSAIRRLLLARRAGARENRLVFRKIHQPFHEAGMTASPFHRFTPVEIAEGASKSDSDNVGFSGVGRITFEGGKRARDLARLMFDPALGLLIRIADSALIIEQDRRLGDAVGEPRAG